jgi:hypothetical protein
MATDAPPGTAACGPGYLGVRGSDERVSVARIEFRARIKVWVE